MEKQEIYKTLEKIGFSNYAVSNKGNVKNIITDLILKPYLGDSYYYKISLSQDKITKRLKIHRLVALMFCKKQTDYKKLIVNHINGNKIDNCAENLEWISQTENLNHAFNIGLTTKKIKAIKCIETGIKYKSSYEASKLLSIGQGSITNVCIGRAKTAGGFKWEYINL